MPGLLSSELCHQSLKRVAQMPLAQVQLGVREASTNGVRKAVVVVAHSPRRRAGKRAEERLPVGLRLACEHLQAPQLRPPALLAHRREDPKRDPRASGVRDLGHTTGPPPPRRDRRRGDGTLKLHQHRAATAAA